MVDSESVSVVLILLILVVGIPLFTSEGGLGSGNYELFNWGDNDDGNVNSNSEVNSVKGENQNRVYVSSEGVAKNVYSPFSGTEMSSSDKSVNEAIKDSGKDSKVVLADERIELEEPIEVSDDISIEGNGATVVPDYSGEGVVVKDDAKVELNNVIFKGFSRGVYVSSDSSSVYINNSVFINSAIGVYIRNSFDDWVINNSEFINNTQGIMVIDTSGDWLVNNTELRQNKNGFNIQETRGEWEIKYNNLTFNRFGAKVFSTDGGGKLSYSNLYSNRERDVSMSGSSIKFENNYWKDERKVVSDTRIIFEPCDTPYCE